MKASTYTRYRDRRKAKGLCPRCGGARDGERVLCKRCRKYMREAERARRARKRRQARESEADPEPVAAGGGYYDPNSGTADECRARVVAKAIAASEETKESLPTSGEIGYRAAQIRAARVDKNGAAVPDIVFGEFVPPPDDLEPLEPEDDD